jgi:hypothetical protein
MRLAYSLLFFSLAACGGTTTLERSSPALAVAPVTPPIVPVRVAKAEPAPAEPTKLDVPTACADSGDPSLCTPPPDFADALCDSSRQDVTLALFSKKAPFTRLYLRGKYDELAFDEEVIALRRSTSSGGVLVNDGTYDVLRWDGTCARGVQAEMLTKKAPPKPLAARLHWSHMVEPVQIALIVGSPKIKVAHAKQGKECLGATFRLSPSCNTADEALSKAIVNYVRQGGAVPETRLTLPSR